MTVPLLYLKNVIRTADSVQGLLSPRRQDMSELDSGKQGEICRPRARNLSRKTR